MAQFKYKATETVVVYLTVEAENEEDAKFLLNRATRDGDLIALKEDKQLQEQVGITQLKKDYEVIKWDLLSKEQ